MNVQIHFIVFNKYVICFKKSAFLKYLHYVNALDLYQ